MLMIQPPPRACEVRQRRTTAVEDAGQVGVDDVVPLSTVISATGVKTPTPALLTRMSRPPKRDDRLGNRDARPRRSVRTSARNRHTRARSLGAELAGRRVERAPDRSP